MSKAFVVMQVGAAGSPERKRADEVYNFIVKPALESHSIEAYRADLDPSPGGITAKMLGELLDARLVIADLTGRNPNVFYELGIAHSFAKPLISIADNASSLPFDAKDERIIPLGDYATTGLTYAQGEAAKRALAESLAVVLADGYVPPSPLREVAANRSLDALAPDNPIAAELGQMREALEDVADMRDALKLLADRSRPQMVVPPTVRADINALREVVVANATVLGDDELAILSREGTSKAQKEWVESLRERVTLYRQRARESADPWANTSSADPWAAARPEQSPGWSDEPPF